MSEKGPLICAWRSILHGDSHLLGNEEVENVMRGLALRLAIVHGVCRDSGSSMNHSWGYIDRLMAAHESECCACGSASGAGRARDPTSGPRPY